MNESPLLAPVRTGAVASLKQGGNVRADLSRAARNATPMLLEMWRAILQRKWWILGATALATAAATIFAISLTPQYTSTALVLLESGGKGRVVSIEEVYSGLGSNRETSTNQLEFLKSRDVSMRVIRKLDLTKHPEFDPTRPGPFSAIGNAIQTLGILPARPKLDQEQIEAIVLQKFQTQLQVEPIRLSQLVKVRFDSSDRQMAASVANEIATAYIQADLDARFAVTERANEWLNSRLAFLKSKLDTSEAELQSYREQAGLIDAKSQASGGSGRQLDELNQQLIEARVRRTLSEQSFNQVRPGAVNLAEVPAIINHPAVQRARAAEVEAARRYNDARTRFGTAHPAYAAADQELRAAKETADQEVNAVAASIRKEYEAARAAEFSLEQTLSKTRTSVQGINRKEIQQSSLEREVEVNKQLYNMFLSRQRETSAASSFQASPARVIDPAVPALRPFSPNKPLISIAAMVVTLVLSSVVAALWHRLDDTIKRADDLEDQIGSPLISAVPKLFGQQAQSAPTVLLHSPISHYAESIRSIASAIQLMTLDSPRKVILVTSAVPGEGKSTVASNLALLQARLCPTLLIEADLRRPVTATRLGLERDLPGLTDFVSGALTLTECVHQTPDSKLWIMPCGRHRVNAAELFSTKAFVEALRSLSGQFEQVIIDSAPVRPVSDALLLSTHATGVLFVAAAESTPAPLVRMAIRKLADSGARIFGVVLNRYDLDRAEKYYGDYASYSEYSEAAPPPSSTSSTSNASAGATGAAVT